MVHDRISQSLNREIRMSSAPPPPPLPFFIKEGDEIFQKWL